MSIGNKMKHSHLSASAAHRWLECPGSVGMSMDVERTDSAASSEGTRAHEVVELLLNNTEPVDVTDEMLSHCMSFVDYVQSIPGVIHSEIQLDYSWVTGVSTINDEVDSFGTSDVVIINDNELHVVDFKYGMTKVSAQQNMQLFLYAMGAKMYFLKGKKPKIFCHIYQPRIDWIDIWEVPDDIYNMTAKIYNSSQQVVQGIKNVGSYLKSGSHCQWCPVRGSCMELNKDMMDFFDEHHVKATPETFAKVLKQKKLMLNWLDAVEEAALLCAKEGKDIPGFTLKDGRKGNRKWSGPVDEILTADVLFKTEVRTPGEVEKLLPRKKHEEIWQELDQVIERAPAKQVLVPDSTSDFENGEEA
jgi:hypothetical protein